jgi:hypothetical protein
VFTDLVRELRAQGLGSKVIADMFGIALRTYHRRVARLSASRTEQGQSLWEAVLRHIQQHGPLLRSDVLQRFDRDDEAVLRSVLLDLIESGLVQRSGKDEATRLAAAEVGDAAESAAPRPGMLEAMVLVALHRSGPLQLEALAKIVPASVAELEAALAKLMQSRLVTAHPRESGTLYGCETCVIGFGDEAGWEAAIFDHYQALVGALVTKLRSGTRRADLADRIGGSTFVFDLWRGHPLQGAVLDYLKTMREHGIALRKQLEQHDAASPKPAGAAELRVIAYVGQTVVEAEVEGEGEDDA